MTTMRSTPPTPNHAPRKRWCPFCGERRADWLRRAGKGHPPRAMQCGMCGRDFTEINAATAKALDAALDAATSELGITTFEPRGRDSLDLPEISVVALRRALGAAFMAGRESARTK